jgi:DNA-binding NtrC family response regulator
MSRTDTIDLLVVDDDHEFRETLVRRFQRGGFAVQGAANGEEALALASRKKFDVAVFDMMMPGISGLQLLEKFKTQYPDCEVILLTGQGTIESAVEAMRLGAYNYLTKPFPLRDLETQIEKAFDRGRLQKENQQLRVLLERSQPSGSMVGQSPAMQEVFRLIERAGPSDKAILIQGESGTGKELVARAIHDQSDRAEKPFVAVNCAAIPENLLESELFGHVKGAFTGAVHNKDGLFETADGGTLFFDEIGELPAPLQVKLLRVIQEKSIRRVGGNTDRRVDVRIVAATNRCLEDEVAAGRFREDLYYRLNVIQIALPPLRERPEDVPLLVQHFIEKYAAELRREIEGCSDEALEALLAYPFPGNVRELENVVERAVALTRDPVIRPDVLPPAVLRPAAAASESRIPAGGVDLDQLVADYERGLILEALDRTGGVKKRAASLLGVSFRSFRYRLDKLGLDGAGADED